MFSKKRGINNHQFMPREHRQKLPFGIHEQQLIAGKNIIDRIPRAKANLERLKGQNAPLALLVLSRVHKEYTRTKHHEAHDAEKRERYYRIASQDVTKLIGRGFIADRVLNEMKINKIDSNFVDAILTKKVLRVPEAKNLAKKIAELENMDRHRAKETKSRLQSMLSAPLSYMEERQKITHYRRASEFIDRQIEIARLPRK